MSKDQPKAGDQRNNRIEREYATYSYPTADGGTATYEYCCSQLTVAEVYCPDCQDWVLSSPHGILGFIICPRCNKEYRTAEKVSANTTGMPKELMQSLSLFAWLDKSQKV